MPSILWLRRKQGDNNLDTNEGFKLGVESEEEQDGRSRLSTSEKWNPMSPPLVWAQ